MLLGLWRVGLIRFVGEQIEYRRQRDLRAGGDERLNDLRSRPHDNH